MILYIIDPASGYHLMELVETHTIESYTTFISLKEKTLKSGNATEIALKYFYSRYARMTPPPNQRTDISLYEVFESIRNDEIVHIKDMQDCKSMKSLYSEAPGSELLKEKHEF